jgi:hypothetical protein
MKSVCICVQRTNAMIESICFAYSIIILIIIKYPKTILITGHGSLVFWDVLDPSSQVAVRLLALCASHSFTPQNMICLILVLFLLEAE